MKYIPVLAFLIALMAIGCSKESADPAEKYASLTTEQADSLIRDRVLKARNEPDDAAKADLYWEAAEVAKANERYPQAVSIYQQFMLDFPSDKRFSEAAKNLSEMFSKQLDKPESAKFLEAAILDKYPGKGKNQSSETKDLKTMLNEQFRKAYPTENAPPERSEVTAYVDASEIYAMFYPEDPETPEILYKAAESARILQSYQKALMLYDWIIDKYPDSERAPQSYFLKGFTYDDNLKQYDRAASLYREFIAKYPDNEFADDAQFLLDNLGKSDEEILENLTQ